MAFTSFKSLLGRQRTVQCSARRAGRPGESPLILGPRGSPPPGQQPGGRPGGGGLILPGGRGGGAPPGRILLPNEKLAGPPGGGGGLGDAPVSGGDRPLPTTYRPPAGFMNDAPAVDEAALKMSDEEMISKLRGRAGRWYDLAKLIPALNVKGFDSNMLDDLTGINPAEQNLWMVGSTVHESLIAGRVAAEVLQHFEQDGASLLYHFRFLPAERRVDAARYIQANNLSAAVRAWGLAAGSGAVVVSRFCFLRAAAAASWVRISRAAVFLSSRLSQQPSRSTSTRALP